MNISIHNLGILMSALQEADIQFEGRDQILDFVQFLSRRHLAIVPESATSCHHRNCAYVGVDKCAKCYGFFCGEHLLLNPGIPNTYLCSFCRQAEDRRTAADLRQGQSGASSSSSSSS